MRAYSGFCPVAKAAEIVAERWTPLIVRELLTGSHRYQAIERGIPGIPHSLLVQRLRSLERAGVVERRPDANGKRAEYWLTAAGQELWEVVRTLGEWGQRWVNHDIGPADTDPQLLMWDIHRRIHLDRLPDRRVVVQFEFRGARRGSFWLVLEQPEPSVCLKDPEFEVDLQVLTDTVALHRVWMGRLALADAMHQGLVEVVGPSDLVRAFPGWLALNVFATVPLSAAPLTPA